MPGRRGRALAVVVIAMFLTTACGGSTANRDHPGASARSESSEELEDEILSGPYDENGEKEPETAEEQAGGVMVAVMFVGMIVGLAVAPLLLLGPLGIF